MTINELQHIYGQHPNTGAFRKLLVDSSVNHIYCGGFHASAAPLFFSPFVEAANHTFVFILGDLEEAGYFYHDLAQLSEGQKVLFFPSSYKRAVKYGQKDAANEILRTEVLSRMQKQEEGLCIVTYPDALAEKVVSKEELGSKTLKLHINEQVDTAFIAEVLYDYGFDRVDYVYEPGQYAVRGSIIDVFSFSSEYPYRIDFFDNEIESIRTFEVETQLSISKKESIAIVPELGLENGSISFFDFIPRESLICMRDFFRQKEQIQSIYNETGEAGEAGRAKEEIEEITVQRAKLKTQLIDGEMFSSEVLQFKRVEFGNQPTGTPDAVLTFATAIQPVYHKNFDLVAASFKEYIGKGYTLFICSDSAKQTDRIRVIFEDRGDRLSFTPVGKTLHEGFADHTLKLCIFTDHQLFDRFHKYNLKSDKARSGKVTLSLKELKQLTPGDFVVHIDHGIGRFAGLLLLPNGATAQEVIKLVYQNEDVVFVSIHSLHKVSKYKGKDGEPPRINKIGSGAWEKLKERTKSKLKDIARDLIKLYSQRREEKGFAFSPDSFLQTELEASFIYEDTPDQSKASVDVKQDMEQDTPMDRLVCGDVGFGKTEVAVRAAFKAAADNKQVAILVPTTVLAYQHYQTFSERLKEFPVKIEYLSRAKSPLQRKKIIEGLKNGEVNILIGTHRILSKDVKFKDLGLLIVDEEQKFGVGVKERLRQLKVNVDTLTMTATPIPRTLQFSLMGARDLSIISTPPPNRYPVQTEVHTFNEEVITDAINFEMSRNGQVFFINNRIASLPEIEAMIRRLIPDARVATGHGQMDPSELEGVILGFVNYDYDVLISTSIVENGIDIPNANTIIVNSAQNFGLSDLHQLRGRVGRSNKKAFCYLLAPPLPSLTKEARQRLQAIENFSDLGSGIHIAMQDLDIRGAGNLLGAEQSGFIADLGYETYQRILSEAVKELKIDEFAELYREEIQKYQADGNERFVEESTVESDLALLLPTAYVTGSSERMLLYRELDGLTSDVDVEAFRARLEDRFGPLPPETEELLRIVPLRRLAAQLGAEKVFLKGERMTLLLLSDPTSPYYQSATFGKLIDYMMKYPRRCNLRDQNGKRSIIIQSVPNVETALNVLREIVALDRL